MYQGVVQQGAKRAEALGFPTINIPLTDANVSGSYAAVVLQDGKTYPAAAYADPTRGVLEAHLLDVSEDLYGKEVQIELKEKIRDAEHFESDEALKEAIRSDVDRIRAYFKL